MPPKVNSLLQRRRRKGDLSFLDEGQVPFEASTFLLTSKKGSPIERRRFRPGSNKGRTKRSRAK